MAIEIRADVVDIQRDTPRESDIFLVDSNIWLWYAYGNAKAQQYQINDYPEYLDKALQKKATLKYSVLSLAELAHVIEVIERDIYNRDNGLDLTTKKYRHNCPDERAKVVAEVESVWSQVESIATSVDLTINAEVAKAAITRFSTQAVDGYDLLIIETISRTGNEQIRVITDDMDYATVPNIQVFTSNLNLIRSANTQGKLLRR